MGDTQNFIHDKYREKISRYSIYCDTDLWLSTLFYNAQKGDGVDICYMRYIRGGGCLC